MLGLNSMNVKYFVNLQHFMLLMALFLGFSFPIASMLIFSVMAGVFYKKLYLFPCFVLILFFSLVNLTRVPDGDFIWYSSHYRAVVDAGFFSSFDAVYDVVIKKTEPVYYFISYVVAFLSNSNVSVFVVSVTSIIYAFCVFSFVLIGKKLFVSEEFILAAALFAITYCVTFTLTNHLIRQYFAGSELLVFVGFLCSGRLRLAAVVFFLSLATHNSVIIPLCILLFSWIVFYRIYSLGVLIFSCILALFLLYGAGMGIPIFFSESADGILHQWDGNVSVLVMLTDFFLFSVVFLFVFCGSWQSEHKKKFCKFILFSCFLFGFFMFSIKYSMLLYLRFYFYMEFFRALLMFCSLVFLDQKIAKNSRFFVVIGVLCVGLYVVYLRMDRSIFHYGGGMDYYLSTNIVDILNDYSVEIDR